MNNTFPKTSIQELPLDTLINDFRPRNFQSEDVVTRLQTIEDAELIGSKDGFSIQRIRGSREIITSSSQHISNILHQLDWKTQIGRRAGSLQRVFKEAGGDPPKEDVSLYRIDGGAINIVRSVSLLRQFGIELAHSWTVLSLRTQDNVRNIIEERQKLGIPEILVAGHARSIGMDGKVEGADTDLFYTRDTFTTTSVDVTSPMPDGRGFRSGTIMFAGVKSDASQGVLREDQRHKTGSNKKKTPETIETSTLQEEVAVGE